MTYRWISLLAVLIAALAVSGFKFFASPAEEATRRLAVIYNLKDPASVEIAHYYQRKRKIPDANMIGIEFNPEALKLKQSEFAILKKKVDAATPGNVQFYALAWTNTVRVECMSITSAFAFGYLPDEGDGSCENTCALGQPNPYVTGLVDKPWTLLDMRPTMMLAGRNVESVKALIDRGIAADGSFPDKATAYLLATSDAHRSVRQIDYPRAEALAFPRLSASIIKGDYIQNRKDVMFYFTGQAHVQGLDTLQFLPGAIADHLTSFGGRPDAEKQMSAIDWLEAGATGSFGTVVEPCNHLQKFPQPSAVIQHYLNGDSLIEAYWKSVKSPGQGVFLGEPLARPFMKE